MHLAFLINAYLGSMALVVFVAFLTQDFEQTFILSAVVLNIASHLTLRYLASMPTKDESS